MLKSRIKMDSLALASISLSYIFFNMSVVNDFFNDFLLRNILFFCKFLFLFIGFLYTFIQSVKNKHLILFLLFSLIGIVSLDKITLEISLSFLILAHFHNGVIESKQVRRFFYYISLTMMWMIIFVFSCYAIGILSSKHYYALNLGIDFLASSKDSLGYRNPNVASSIIASIVIVSFVMSYKKMYFISLLVYFYTFQYLLSKTFLPIILMCLVLNILEKFKMSYVIQIGAFASIIFTVCALVISYVFVFPYEFKEVVPLSLYSLLDPSTTLRLSFSEIATLNTSTLELLFGVWWPKNYIDSGLANLNFSIGIVGAVAIFCWYIYIMYINFSFRNFNIVYFLMLFVIINLFESVIYFNSLLFILTLYIITSSTKEHLYTLSLISKRQHGGL